MPIEIVTTRQHLAVAGVTDIAVSAIAHDDVEGDFYRDITFFGEPPAAGGTVPTVLSVRIRATTVDPLKITAPQDEF